MWETVLKPAAIYAGTAALTAVAQRYHLSGDQVMAISGDLAALGTAAYGVYVHNQALKKDPKDV